MVLSVCLHAQVHAYIISSLKKEMPSVFGKENKKKELIASLGDIYKRIEREHQISPGDFPNLKKMQVSEEDLQMSRLLQGSETNLSFRTSCKLRTSTGSSR